MRSRWYRGDDGEYLLDRQQSWDDPQPAAGGVAVLIALVVFLLALMAFVLSVALL